jgi:hypothetical protein
VGKILEVDVLPLEPAGPRPDRDVGDGIGARDELDLGEPPVENAIEAFGLGRVTLLRVGYIKMAPDSNTL